MNFRAAILALLCCFFLQLLASSAAPVPDLKATTEWLKHNLPAEEYIFDQTTDIRINSNYDVKRCRLTIERQSFEGFHASIVHPRRTFTVLFMEARSGQLFDRTHSETLDSHAPAFPRDSNSYVETWVLLFSQVQPSRISVRHVVPDGRDPRSRADEFLFDSDKRVSFVISDDLAPRLLRALRRAVELCGGKDDPY